MKTRISILAAATVLAGATMIAQQAPATAPAAGAQQPGGRGQGRGQGAQGSPFSTPPIRIFLYGGLKTHAEGQHDYPQFVADWSKLLMNRNAIVDGALRSCRAIPRKVAPVAKRREISSRSLSCSARADRRRGRGSKPPLRLRTC